MARRNLTDERIRSLKPATRGTRYEVSDHTVPGLFVRVGSKSKKFVLISRFGGATNSTRRTIGDFPKILLEQAREIARDWNDIIDRGLDPKLENRSEMGTTSGRRSSSREAMESLQEGLHEVFKAADLEAVVLMSRSQPWIVVMSAEEFIRLKEAAGEPVGWKA